MPYISRHHITDQYKEIKELGRLIRSQRFNVSNRNGGTDLDFRITHIKSPVDYHGVDVNIKVSGNLWGWGYFHLSDTNGGVPVHLIKNNPRRRNNKIRREVRDEIRNFFKLLGIEGWRIEIKNITISESI